MSTAPEWRHVPEPAGVGRGRARRRGGGTAVASAVLLNGLGLLAVVAPWAVQRLVRFDPLGSSSGWAIRTERGTRSTVASVTSLTADQRHAGQRGRHRVVTALPVAALVVLAAVALASLRPTRGAERQAFLASDTGVIVADDLPAGVAPRYPVPDGVEERRTAPEEMPAAMLSSTDWYNVVDTSGWMLEPGGAWRPLNHYNKLDFAGPYVNVTDGTRHSWTPPPCGCRRVRVWMYGGSTTFGINQRDDHTIASELARVAHDHGITIDIDNRGGNGQLQWTEAERFAWDLTIDDAPDLVFFYDGMNDLWSGTSLNLRGKGPIKPFFDPTTFGMWESSGRSAGAVPPGPAGAEPPPPGEITLDIGPLERAVIERYDRARSLSKTVAAAHDVTARYFWQPTRFSRPLVPSEPHADSGQENRSRLSEALLLSMLPDDVIDVSGALVGTREPLFTDDVHHNELGARLIATAIFEHLEQDLTAILSGPATSG